MDRLDFTLLEPGDVARELDLSASMVRVLVSAGALRTVARTRRGVRLFDPSELERLRLQRAQRRRMNGASTAAGR